MNYTWIRTSDRYPPNGVEVLAWIVGGSLHHGEDYYDKALYLNGVWRANCGDKDEPVLVSHWMPRPQAPKDQVMLSAEERDLTIVAQLLEWLKEQERQMSASVTQRSARAKVSESVERMIASAQRFRKLQQYGGVKTSDRGGNAKEVQLVLWWLDYHGGPISHENWVESFDRAVRQNMVLTP